MLGCLGGGAEEFTDALPGHTGGSGCGDGVDDLAFAACPSQGGAFEEVLLDRALIAWLGFGVRETFREFVGVVARISRIDLGIRSPGTWVSLPWRER